MPCGSGDLTSWQFPSWSLRAPHTSKHITKKWLEIVFYDFTSVFNLFGLPQIRQYQWAMPLDGTGGHFWSVNAEEQFYLLAPLVLVLLPSRHGRRVITWIVIALVAWVSRCYASIAFGVLAAVVAESLWGLRTLVGSVV